MTNDMHTVIQARRIDTPGEIITLYMTSCNGGKLYHVTQGVMSTFDSLQEAQDWMEQMEVQRTIQCTMAYGEPMYMYDDTETAASAVDTDVEGG